MRRSQVKKSRHEEVVNAFWQRDELCLVVKDPDKRSGVRIRRSRAEHSCFIKKADGDRIIDGEKTLYEMLKPWPVVMGIEAEGDWYRIKWRDRDDCKKYCKSLAAKNIPTFEGVVSPVMRYMVDNDVPIAEPRKCWIDLETDSDIPFSRAEEDARILCWTIEDEAGNVFEGLLDEDTDLDETRLLREMWAVLDVYDLITAWNGDRFDFPIIKCRTRQRRIQIEFRRWQWLDQMVLFQRMNVAAESGEEKQSSKLDFIANALLGVGKHSFDASKTREAWETKSCEDLTCMQCRGCLLKYCGQDTGLMPKIEEKTGFIQLLRTLANACGTFADSRGVNPSIQVEGFLQRLALKTGHKFPTVLELGSGEKYEGAYVMEPTCTGIIKNVHVADYTSLYPSIIITWNMSPETRRKAPVSGDLTGLSYSPLTGIHFDVTKPGILPIAVGELMRLRKHWNKLKASLPPGSPKWKDADRKSTAYKVAANSFYGVIGSSNSRFYDRAVGESIAQCAKWLILQAVEEANKHDMEVIYADTDSVFVVDATRKKFEKFVEHCNENLWPKVLKGVGCKKNLIDLAYEKEFERIIFGYDLKKQRSTKKKYIGRYVHFKGTKADPKTSKPEIKGFEYKRGDAIRFVREMQAEVIELLVGYTKGGCEDPKVFEEVLDRWKARILDEPLALDDVVIGKKLAKSLDGYIRKMKKDGSGYARQLPHIEIARERRAQGHDVGEGVRIEYFIFDGGKSPMTCLPVEDWDRPIDPRYPDGKTCGEMIDRFVIWDKQVYPPTERLIEAAFPGYHWEPWRRTRPKKARATRKYVKAG